MGRLDHKVVVVTGGGIGRGACLRIAEEGGIVVVADIREPLAVQVAAEVTAAGGRALPVICDVADEGQVAAAMAAAVAQFGSINGLVASARRHRQRRCRVRKPGCRYAEPAGSKTNMGRPLRFYSPMMPAISPGRRYPLTEDIWRPE